MNDKRWNNGFVMGLAVGLTVGLSGGCRMMGMDLMPGDDVREKRVTAKTMGEVATASTASTVPDFEADADKDGDVDLADHQIAQQEFTGPDDLATTLTLAEHQSESRLYVDIKATVAPGWYASGGQFVLSYPEALVFDVVQTGALTNLWTAIEHVDSSGGPFVEIVMGGMSDRVEGQAILATVEFVLRDGHEQPPPGSVRWTTWTHCKGVVTTGCGSPNMNCENQVIGVCDRQIQHCVNSRITSSGRVLCPLVLKPG